jgi:hypothetical protein
VEVQVGIELIADNGVAGWDLNSRIGHVLEVSVEQTRDRVWDGVMDLHSIVSMQMWRNNKNL